MTLSGIYLLTHAETGRKYVGQSRDINKRLQKHAGGHSNHKIGNAIRRHGWAAFNSEILELCPTDLLNEREAFWIEIHGCIAPHGFNLTGGGDNRIISDETRQRMSVARSGKTNSPESIAKTKAFNTGRKRSPETIAKVVAALTGLKRSPEERARISAALTGRKLSPEHIANRSAAMIGTKRGHYRPRAEKRNDHAHA